MITLSKNSGQRGGGCRRCRIIRLFIIASFFVVILGLVGGEHLRYLSFLTAEGVAAFICIAGGISFIIKFLLWFFQKPGNETIDHEQA